MGAGAEGDRDLYHSLLWIAAARTWWASPGPETRQLVVDAANRAGPPTAGEKEGTSFGTNSFDVKVPTLVIWGEKDTALLTGNLEGLDKYVPQLTIKRIPDGTHWVIHEKPELVNTYIREFITSK